MQKEKVFFWQFLRGLCIVLVVLIHSNTGIPYQTDPNSTNFDYWLIERALINFPVAMFIFLSGYFTNTEKILKKQKGYIYCRIKRLIIPFFVWSSTYTLISIVISGEFSPLRDITNLLLGLSSPQLYYILVLTQLTLLSPILIKTIIDLKYHRIIFLITPLYLGILYLYVHLFGEQFSYYQTLFPAWLIFFYLGLWIRINGYPKLLANNFFCSILILIVALLYSVYESYAIIYKGFSVSFASSQIKVSSFILTMALINLIFNVDIFNFKKFKVMKYLGDHSYGIFYIHIVWSSVVDKVLSLLPIISNNFPIFQLLQVIFTLIFSVISIKITTLLIGKKNSNKLLGF